jgi:hypothetical protein
MCKEVGMAELEAYIYAREFRAIDGMSSPLSYDHPGRWIRRYTRRYTLQGAAFRILNSVPPTASAPPT